MIKRTHQERRAIQDELRDGNAPRIEMLHRTLAKYEGKMFKVDGTPTKAFKAVLDPLELNKKSSGHYFQDGLKVNITYLQVRAGYTSLELHIRATSTRDGEQGINYIEHIIYLGKFSFTNYNYNFNEADLNSMGSILEQIHNYNPYMLEDVLTKRDELTELEDKIKALKDTMPYYSY